MNALIYNVMLEDSENIAGFFRDQPGGQMCLALILDICQDLIEKEKSDALECVIETLYTICEISKRWDGAIKETAEIFVDMIAMQFSR